MFKQSSEKLWHECLLQTRNHYGSALLGCSLNLMERFQRLRHVLQQRKRQNDAEEVVSEGQVVGVGLNQVDVWVVLGAGLCFEEQLLGDVYSHKGFSFCGDVTKE